MDIFVKGLYYIVYCNVFVCWKSKIMCLIFLFILWGVVNYFMNECLVYICFGKILKVCDYFGIVGCEIRFEDGL